MRPSSRSQLTSIPISLQRFTVVSTSEMLGTFVKVHFLSDKRERRRLDVCRKHYPKHVNDKMLVKEPGIPQPTVTLP